MSMSPSKKLSGENKSIRLVSPFESIFPLFQQ